MKIKIPVNPMTLKEMKWHWYLLFWFLIVLTSPIWLIACALIVIGDYSELFMEYFTGFMHSIKYKNTGMDERW